MFVESWYLQTLYSIFTRKSFIHAISGGLGSAFSISLLYPLDTVRVRLQVDEQRVSRHSLSVVQEIVSEEGISALYRGWSILVRNLFMTNFIYFYVFHGLKITLSDRGFSQDALKDLIFGTLAGFVTVVLTNPLWIVSMRMQLTGAKLSTARHRVLTKPRYRGMLDCLYKVASLEGIHALWGGTAVSLMLVSNPIINFVMYEALKRYLHFMHQDFYGAVHFVNGALSKMVATVLTYPLQVIQTRLRAGCDVEHSTSSMLQCVAVLVRNNGVAGLYRGLESKLSQTVLTSAITLLSYEKIASLVSRLSLVTLQ